MHSRYLRIAVALWAFGANAFAATLPGNLSPADIDASVGLIGFGSTSRLMRSAEAYATWPGFKVGFETPMADARSIRGFGDRGGSVPGLYIVPRFYLAKGLAENFEVVLSLLPTGSSLGVGTYGGFLKWTIADERTQWASAAIYGGFTHMEAFRGDYTGQTMEVGFVMSKDYVRFKPYLGFGIIMARGSVRPELASTSMNTASQTKPHFKIGAELDLPVNLTVQIDAFDDKAMCSLFLGARF